MKKKILLMGIYLVAIATVLVLAVVTFAWYTANSGVSSSPTYVTSVEVEGAGIESVADNIKEYNGETGLSLSDNDKPYVATKIFYIEQTASSSSLLDVLICNLKNVTVTLPSGQVLEGEECAKHFTYRLEVVTLNSDKSVSSTKGTFYPASDGIVVDKDSKALHYLDSNYFTVEQVSSTEWKCSTYVQLQFIFLDETSYENLIGTGNNNTAFVYSAYDYMGSQFVATFEIGTDAISQDDGRAKDLDN